MVNRTVLALVCFLCAALFLRADPAEVVIGDLTFVRPPSWPSKEPTGKSTAQALFIVSPAKGPKRPMVDVRFYIEEKDGINSDGPWKSHFPDATGPDAREEKKEFGKRQVTFLTLHGSYATGRKMKKHPDFLLINATVPFGPKVIHVRILGPEPIVHRASAPFRTMIENALKQKAAE